MPVDSERLIDAAVRGMRGDEEARLLARGKLSEMLEHAQDTGFEKDAKEMVSRWSSVDAKRSRFSWKMILVCLVVIATGLAASSLRQELSYALLLINWAKPVSPEADLERRTGWKQNHQPKAEQFLLYGDLSERSLSGQRRALWESEPLNPAYYSEYAYAYLRENEELPPDFLKTVARIDSDNALPLYIAANELAKKAVQRNHVAGKPVLGKTKDKWSIVDASRLDEALSIANQAASKSTFNSYQHDLAKIRIPLVPKSNRSDHLHSANTLFELFPEIRLRHLMSAFAAKASDLASNKDREEFKQLAGSADSFARHMAMAESHSLIGNMMVRVLIETIYEPLEKGALILKLNQEATQFKAINQRFDQYNSDRKSGAGSRGLDANRIGMSDLHILPVARQLAKPVTITPEQLLPGAYEDHALISRAAAVAGWMIFLMGYLLLLSNRLFVSKMTFQLSRRLESLLKPVDYLWIVGLGVILPVCYVLGVSRLTPLDAREWSVVGSFWILPAAHFLAMFLLIVVVSARSVKWRMGKRTKPLGLDWGQSISGWMATFFGVILVPAAGWVVKERLLDETDLLTYACLTGGLMMLLFFVLLKTTFSSGEKRLTNCVTGRALMPVFACAMLLMLALVPVFKAEENHWFRQNELVRMDANFPAMTKFEYQVSQRMQQELREVLGIDRAN